MPPSEVYATHGFYTRQRSGDNHIPPPFGPLGPDHPLVGQLCLGCDLPFSEGEYGYLLPIGPGGDLEERERARTGRAYNARSVPLHVACVAGG